MPQLAIGMDVAKDAHWVVVLTAAGDVVWEQAVPNDGPALEAMLAAVRRVGEGRVWGVDVVGGLATLATAVLVAAGEAVVYVPGVVVNRARDALPGGEAKSDPRDARVIAEQVHRRGDWRRLLPDAETVAALRVLVGRRRDVVTQQTRRLAQLRELLLTVHPELERRLEVTTQAALVLLTRYVTPGELRRVGRQRVGQALRARGIPAARAAALATTALECAQRQRLALPAEAVTAAVCKELAAEALAARARLAQLEQQLAEVLAAHPEGALIQSLPGMGVVLTSEWLAVAGEWHRFASAAKLAAAAGVAPVLRQSGRVRVLRRARRGHRVLKWVLYQSAHCAVQNRDPASRRFYERKRQEGKSHRQAVLALARRRVDVLWAMLTHGCPYQERQELSHAA
jgi:transposase